MFYEVEIPEIVVSDIAKRVYDKLYKTIFSLNFMSEMYQRYLGEYRRIIVDGSYKIIYKVDEENKKVIIIRVVRTERVNFDLV